MKLGDTGVVIKRANVILNTIADVIKDGDEILFIFDRVEVDERLNLDAYPALAVEVELSQLLPAF